MSILLATEEISNFLFRQSFFPHQKTINFDKLISQSKNRLNKKEYFTGCKAHTAIVSCLGCTSLHEPSISAN